MNSTTDYPSTELATFSHLDQATVRTSSLDLVFFPALYRDPFNNTKQMGSLVVFQLLHLAKKQFLFNSYCAKITQPKQTIVLF